MQLIDHATLNELREALGDELDNIVKLYVDGLAEQSAALATLLSMPGFLYDGILTGVTLNQMMRNGMLASFVVFLAALLALQGLGSAGLWLALASWFVARAAYYWWGLERRREGLFT